MQETTASQVMSGRERVSSALRGEATDRPALAYQFFGGAHTVLAELGQTMSDVYRSAVGICEAQITSAELFGHDTAMAPWGCLTVEAEAFGCSLRHYEMYYPQIVARPLEQSTNLNRLNSIDAQSLPERMQLTVDALSSLRRDAGDNLFVIGMVVSPFLVACELRGMTQFFIDLGASPGFASELLEVVAEGICSYIDAIVASKSCDALMFENAVMSADMLGPHHVARFVRPPHLRVVQHARRQAPGLRLIEHNCASSPYWREIQETGVDAVSFASADLEAALEPASSDRGLAGIGAVDHSRLIWEGSPEAVYDAAMGYLKKAAGRPFVLSTGCEIPFKAPTLNIQALAAAAHAFSS